MCEILLDFPSDFSPKLQIIVENRSLGLRLVHMFTRGYCKINDSTHYSVFLLGEEVLDICVRHSPILVCKITPFLPPKDYN